METKLIKDLSHYTGFSDFSLLNFINKAPYSYKHFTIHKIKGGTRNIAQPTRETKALQYALIDLLFEKLPIHNIAYAYNKTKSPLKKIADLHKKYNYTLKTDLQDFFPSIKFYDLKNILSKQSIYILDDTDLNYIRNICFIYQKKELVAKI